MGDTFFTFLCATLVLEAALAFAWLELEFHCAVCQHAKSDHVKLRDCSVCEGVDRGCRHEKTPVPREIAEWLARERQGIRALLEPPPLPTPTLEEAAPFEEASVLFVDSGQQMLDFGEPPIARVSLEQEAHMLWLRENAGASLGPVDADGHRAVDGPLAGQIFGIAQRVQEKLIQSDPLLTKLREGGVGATRWPRPRRTYADYGVFTGDFQSTVQSEIIREGEVLKFYSEHLPREILGLEPDDERRFPVDVWWAHGKKSLVITCFAAPRATLLDVHKIVIRAETLMAPVTDSCALIVLHPDDLDRVLRGELSVPAGFGELWQRLF